jgi:hypothetical protein
MLAEHTARHALDASGGGRGLPVSRGALERARLNAIVGDPSRPLKHILRARIVLLSAECLSVQKVAWLSPPLKRVRPDKEVA